MKFTQETLRSTFEEFRSALRGKKIQIGWEPSLNLWSQIIVGKNYSGAISQAKAGKPLDAVPQSVERIQQIFAGKNQEVDAETALDIVKHAVLPGLAVISPAMFSLAGLLTPKNGRCLRALSNGIIGLFDEDKPGYLSIERLGIGEPGLGWVKASPEFAVALINRLADISENDEWQIFSGAAREGFRQNDMAFSVYFTRRGQAFSESLANRIMERWPDSGSWEQRPDYDQLSDLVFTVIEDFCAEGKAETNGWLKAECSLADALRDHVTARVRDAMPLYADKSGDAFDSLQGTIEFAVRNILE